MEVVTADNPLPYQGPPTWTWYGRDPAWRLPFEAAARRRHGEELLRAVDGGRLTYRLRALEVTGRPDPVPVDIIFYARQLDRHFGLPVRDMPVVYADPGAESPHRNGDDSLCLWFPGDPEQRRWRSELGLLVLLDLIAEHLFAELHWRATGGARRGEWVLDEAPHGFPNGRAA
ncbi:hypothetical protein ACFWE5_15740 [Cellulosimicrobium funkei]|uniref:hypothetical protein n=1 Tax=Cellulosimicrobium funkei TaxID=264251 RepID=UPI003669161C